MPDKCSMSPVLPWHAIFVVLSQHVWAMILFSYPKKHDYPIRKAED